MIIGIVGSIASGKDTVADYLKTKGFKAISLSDILRQYMRERNLDITTFNMTDVGNKLREERGHGYLAEDAVSQIKADENVVVTSIRQVGEINVLKKQPNFVLLKLDAPIELRLERLIRRNRDGDIKNMAELKEIEAKQANGSGGGINMNECYKLADKTIINDGTLDELSKKVDQLISEIK